MKKILVLALALMTAGALAACSKPAEEPKTTEAPVESVPETTPTADQPPETVAPGGDVEFKIVTGPIAAVSDTFSDITVESGGQELKFDISSATIETSYEMTPNTDITLIYKGEVSGTDTSRASVILAIDAQKDLEVKTLEGSVVAQGMSVFTIQVEDGSEVNFLKDNCEGLNSGVLGQAKDDRNGSGEMVKVTYVTANYDVGTTEGESSGVNFPLKVEAAG